jgi:hypothetical protein
MYHGQRVLLAQASETCLFATILEVTQTHSKTNPRLTHRTSKLNCLAGQFIWEVLWVGFGLVLEWSWSDRSFPPLRFFASNSVY